MSDGVNYTELSIFVVFFALVVKAGAVVVILVLDPQFSIDLHRRGDHPADAAAARLRPLHALLPRLGTARRVGRGPGRGPVPALRHAQRDDGQGPLGGSLYLLSKLGLDVKSTIYPGLVALVLNVAVAVLVTLLLRAVRAPRGEDTTHAGDYELDADDPGLGNRTDSLDAPARG